MKPWQRYILAFAGCLVCHAAIAAEPLSVLSITPSGDDVPAARQIVISFNRAVVPPGKMERTAAEVPITITPAIPCEWRWINTSALACNLPEKGALALSTRYHIEVKPGIKAEDGATLEQPYNDGFVTERPVITDQQFYLWKSPGLPVIRLVFNQAVSRESLEQHGFMVVKDTALPLTGAAGDQKVRLKIYPDTHDNEIPHFLPLPGENYTAFVNSKPRQSDDTPMQAGGREARRVWLVEPESELPLDTHIVFQLEAGLVSALGSETSIEARDVVEFDTFPAFAFLGVKCTSNAQKNLIFLPDNHAPSHEVVANRDVPPDAQDIVIPAWSILSDSEKCNPLEPVVLLFNSPVEHGMLGQSLQFTPEVKGWKKSAGEEEGPDESPEAPVQATADNYNHLSGLLKQSHEKGRVYALWLPGGLKAAEKYRIESRSKTMGYWARFSYWVASLFREQSPVEIADMFGRNLSLPVSVTFATNHRQPNFVFDHHDAVLEKGIDSEVPLFVDNLNQTILNYRSISSSSVLENQVFTNSVPKVNDLQFAIPFGIRAALKGGIGALYGSLQTDPDTGVHNQARRIFAEVTPWQVHFKFGHFSSLAWVTDFASGQPVADAKVTLYKDAFATLGVPGDGAATATTDHLGIALLPGTDTLDPDLKINAYGNDSQSHFFLRVDKVGDMALLPLSSDFMINSYRVSGSGGAEYANNRERYGHIHSWGMTAQGIYRAGDTMQYKIYVRDQNDKGFILPPLALYNLKIMDSMGKKVHEVKHIRLSEYGALEGEYAIPKTAAVGWYNFRLSANFDGVSADDTTEDDEDEPDNSKLRWTPLRVLVSDFTPAPFKVTSQLNGDSFHAGQQVESTTRAELHSGGPYTKASARVTALLQAMPFISRSPLAQNFRFDSFVNEQESQQVFQKIDSLNDKGELQQCFDLGKPNIVYGKIMLESAVQDERGKYITGSVTADYVGLDRLVGLHSRDWLYTTGQPATIDAIVVDAKGVPAAGTDIAVKIEHETTRAARVKSAGNAYLTEYHSDWEPVSDCTLKSQPEAASCSFTPKEAGNYRATASIRDTKGNPHSTVLSGYATGADFVVWGDQSDTSLTLVPEKTDYRIGDKARFLVKNPYPGAKALITIERYGIMDQFVQTLEGSTPVVEFPVKPDYVPGFYLSVTIMSPRVDKPLEGQVDLGKPAFRMGYVTVNVRDPYKEMLVTAKADKEVYKPRENVQVTLHTEPRHKDKAEPMEMAVVVLDESVLDLIAKGRDAFDPYKGFYTLENLDVRNFSLLLNLVGRQKFEKKGANPGGDGGHDAGMRSLFRFVSYWNPAIKPDADGNATISFEAPDNLTGWRILALAATPTDRFGLGEAGFKVNKPTEIRPVMPNQVTENDRFNAGFSVMNRTDRERELKVTINAEGNVEPETRSGRAMTEHTETIKLPPYQRTTVFMPIKTTAVGVDKDVSEGGVTFTVTAEDATDRDAMQHHLPVYKQRSLETAASYGTTAENHAETSIAFPASLVPDVGSISVELSPTVIGNIAGAFKYMQEYPYLCWEQQLTKGVMAAHYQALKAYMPESLVWKDSVTLPQATLDNAGNFQAPGGGMAYFIPDDRHVDPYLSAYTALGFNWLRIDGYKVPEAVEGKLQDYLLNLLRNDAMPDFYSEGMASSVRAVALAALAENGKISKMDIDRYVPHVPKMSLFGKANFLQAALKTGADEALTEGVVKKLLASSSQTSGKFIFSETLDDGYARILASPLRDNCAILSSFIRYAATDKGKTQLADVPFKMVRMITQSRQSRDHWENTQENMFCMQALADYARVYEQASPDMAVKATLDAEALGEARFKSVKDAPQTLGRPLAREDVGKKATLKLDKAGQGRLYYATRLTYAMPPSETHAANAGMEIHREYSVERGSKWELLHSPIAIRRGELIRVDLYVSLPAARNFVVVDDPVPGALEPINRQLATASSMDAGKGAFAAAGGSWWFHYADWSEYGISFWSFYHQELRDNAARFYADYLPAGNYHLSYTAQAIATGSFTVMPALAQEMYDTDVFGRTEAIVLQVEEK